MVGQDEDYFTEANFNRMGEENSWIPLFLRAVLANSIQPTTSNWVKWETLFNMWRTQLLEDENFSDTQDYLRNSPSLRKWLACSLKQDPPDKPWEYSAESRITEIERITSKARRAVTNAIQTWRTGSKPTMEKSLGILEPKWRP